MTERKKKSGCDTPLGVYSQRSLSLFEQRGSEDIRLRRKSADQTYSCDGRHYCLLSSTTVFVFAWHWRFDTRVCFMEKYEKEKKKKYSPLNFPPFSYSIFFFTPHSVHCSIHVDYGKQPTTRGRRGMFHLFRQPAKEHIRIWTRNMLWKGNAYQMWQKYVL